MEKIEMKKYKIESTKKEITRTVVKFNCRDRSCDNVAMWIWPISRLLLCFCLNYYSKGYLLNRRTIKSMTGADTNSWWAKILIFGTVLVAQALKKLRETFFHWHQSRRKEFKSGLAWFAIQQIFGFKSFM